MLHGITVENHEDTLVEDRIEISNWVIYKNLDTDALYLVDDSGNKKQDIIAERAFFSQQYITTGDEQ